jgi:hypothetical protein
LLPLLHTSTHNFYLSLSLSPAVFFFPNKKYKKLFHMTHARWFEEQGGMLKSHQDFGLIFVLVLQMMFY